MNTLLVVLFFLSIFILVVFAINYYNTKQVVLRALSKLTPKSYIQFNANEAITLSGRVQYIDAPLEAPFSKRKCVGYVIKIEQKTQIGKNKQWNTLVEKEVIQDFLLAIKGTHVMVKPKSAPKDYLSYFVADKKETSGILNAPSTHFEDVLERYGIRSKNRFGLNKTMRYTERVLEIGETVTIGGIAKWKTLDTPLQGYNYSKIATLETQDQQQLIITDLPEVIINDV